MVFEYLKISPGFASRRPYHFRCPVCNAPPGFLCVSRKTGRPERRAHVSRGPQQSPPALDLRAFYRAMAPFDRQGAKTCPDWFRAFALAEPDEHIRLTPKGQHLAERLSKQTPAEQERTMHEIFSRLRSERLEVE